MKKSLITESSRPHAYRDLYISLLCMGDLAKANRDTHEAFSAYQQSVAVSKYISELLGTPHSFEDVVIACANCLELFKTNDTDKSMNEILHLWKSYFIKFFKSVTAKQ